MVSIIIQYEEEDEHDFKRCWHPLIYKHGEMDFIVISPTGLAPVPDTNNFRVVRTNIDALAVSQKTWFITPVNEIPTYQTMIQLQSANGKGDCLHKGDLGFANCLGCNNSEGTMYNIKEMLL